MKLVRIKINYFRGIENVEINFNEMLNFIVSNNNVGKTRVLECINQFYSSTKENVDLEFTYHIYKEEQLIIQDYLDMKEEILENSITINLKNKKYTYKEKDAKKLIEAKILGEIIYIPAVSDHNNVTDISKTTTDISKMISRLLDKNESVEKKLEQLNYDLRDYIKLVQEESKNTISKMNNDILFGNIELSLENKEFENSQIIKNNIQLKAKEDGDEKEISSLGTGVQRSIVNSIITAGLDSDKYTILLYDEPETFLNVTLQRKLMQVINKNKKNTQYIIATHSPDIIYRNERIFSSIIKLKKCDKNNIEIFQFNNEKYKLLIKEAETQLNNTILLTDNINESILAWWDRNRVNALFEDKILVVEGPTEEIFMDIICNDKNISYISTCGKYSIPFFKVLFKEIFDIEIIVMCDKDNEENLTHKELNKYIKNNFDKYLLLENEFEDVLGYKTKSERRKPQEFLENYFNNKINDEKIKKLKEDIYKLWE